MERFTPCIPNSLLEIIYMGQNDALRSLSSRLLLSRSKSRYLLVIIQTFCRSNLQVFPQIAAAVGCTNIWNTSAVTVDPQVGEWSTSTALRQSQTPAASKVY